MPKRKPGASLRFGRSKRGRQLALQDLARRYRPRKSERDSVVFLAIPTPDEIKKARRNKKPVPRFVRLGLGARRKAIALAVGPGGATRVISTGGRAYMRPGTQDLVRAAADDPRLKKAVERTYEGKWYSAYRREGEKVPDWGSGRLPPWNEGALPLLKSGAKSGVSFDLIAERVAYELRRVLRRRGRVDHNLFVRWRAVTRSAASGSRDYREWFGVVKFQAGFRQQLEGDLLARFALLTIYASLAQQLSGSELVTAGSAARVRRMNPRGVPRREWKQGDGQRWEKNEYGEVVIKVFEFDIDELRL